MSEKSSETGNTSMPLQQPPEIIPGYASMEQFTKDGFKVLMEAIKNSNAVPSGRDWDFYNTSDSFKRIMNDESSSVLQLMNQLMRCNDIDSNIRNRVLDEKIELVIEANDVILERVANNIDELNGIRKGNVAPVVLQTVSAQLPINGSWNRPSTATFSVNSTASQFAGRKCIKLLTAKNIIRPQKFFKDRIDNRNKVPWQPRITDKPNSLKPLAIFLEECGDRQEFSHPYEYELDRFAPTSEQLLEEKPTLPKALSDTPLIEINRPEQLDELVEGLRQCKEFAVDVEHHSYRSFMGITCLLQISTKDKDYLIDTLALRDKLSILNEVFTKNSIVKIFHGADKDVEWLQRDLSIYVVNMFDTHQAAKMLQYQSLSLAFLMKKFCNVLPNKEYQLADWRIRPLPEELKQYAREDTHYLIYIYKMLKKELLFKANRSESLLLSVIERSTELCKKRYFKPILQDDTHMGVLRKCKKMFDNRQLYALKEIYAWRDHVAREEDESCGYVLPNHMMLQISENLPREMQGILACCNPIPPLVKSHLLQLHQIVLKARDQPLEKAILKDTTGRGVLKEISKVNVDSVLHCPHDLSKSQEFRDDLPTLLQSEVLKLEIRKVANSDLGIEKSSSYSIFNDTLEPETTFNECATFKKFRGFAYFSPYERYMLVKPFVVAEDKATEVQNEEIKQEPKQRIPVENISSERTDEERIASIRDHFIQLSKKFSEELQAQKEKEEAEERQRERSMIEEIVSRKRKREDEFHYTEQAATSTNNEEFQVQKGQRELSLREIGGSRKRKKEEEEYDYYTERSAMSADTLHCPRPRMNQNYQPKNRNRGRKRRFNEMDNQGEPVNGSKNKKQKKGKKNNQQQQPRYFAEQGQNMQDQGYNPQQNNQSRFKKKNKNKNQQHNQRMGFQHPETANNEQIPQLNNARQNRQQQKQNKGRRNMQPQQQNKGGQNFQPQQQNKSGQNFQPQQQNKSKQKMQPQQQNNGGQNFQPQQQNQFRRNTRSQQQNKNKRNMNARNDNTNFTAYDYASVDFRQFQGGAGAASSGVQIKPKFKPKNWKNKNKKGAKAASFASGKPNRGGYQGGNF